MSLRYRVCPDCGAMHDVHDWPGNHRFWNEVVCMPMVIRDGLDDLRHPSDNKYYDSKRAFRQTTKDFGGEEIGNEDNPDNRWVDQITMDDIHEAKQKVDQGYKPAPASATSEDMAGLAA